MTHSEQKCPNAKKHGEIVCIGGYMWELTHSEMGPPGSRQNTGDKCTFCANGDLAYGVSGGTATGKRIVKVLHHNRGTT